MKNRFRALELFAVIVLLFTQSCEKNESKKKEKAPVAVQEKQVRVPIFNADSAYRFVKEQVDFGPRVPNTPAHNNCKAYLEEKLRQTGFEVQGQDFQATAYNGKKLDLTNIIASLNPKATKRILLAAHWDSRPFADQDSVDQKTPIDGANDGASGTAILIEVAKTIQTAPDKPGVGVDIILFDGEDYGQPDFDDGEKKDNTWCLGSQYWSRNKHKKNYSAYYGILLDMVGAKSAHFAMEGTSMYYAPSVVQKVWNIAQQKGYQQFFISREVPPIIDDHAYINKEAGIPMVDIIEFNPQGETFFGEYWHTHQDNISVIDPATLEAVGQTLLEVIYRE